MSDMLESAKCRGMLIENDDDWLAIKIMLGEIFLGIENATKPNKNAAFYIRLAMSELNNYLAE
jgi:hypothetical protein